jgi:hypothetical protein
MIKTTLTGYPIFHQSDNTYSLPSYTGTVQWNGTMKKFQVSNGSGWTDIDNYITYNVDSNLLQAMQWVEKKMREEIETEQLAKSNPAINDLLKQIKEKQEQIKIVKTLISNGSN